MSPQTKKLLVPFDPANPESNLSGFLIPKKRDGRSLLVGLENGKEYEYGRVVFIGMPITENDLFARLVDSGARIENVQEMLADLREYIQQLQSLRIGNVARIRPRDAELGTIGLELISEAPWKFGR